MQQSIPASKLIEGGALDHMLKSLYCSAKLSSLLFPRCSFFKVGLDAFCDSGSNVLPKIVWLTSSSTDKLLNIVCMSFLFYITRP